MSLFCFADVLRGGNVANLYNGLEQKVETVLPIGEASLNYEMDIIAMVSDKYGYATKTYLKVQVYQSYFVVYRTDG